MPKKIANKDLPVAADVPGGEALVAAVGRRKARLAKAAEAAPEAVRAARKRLKRAQRKLRKARIHTALKGRKPAAAAEG